MVGAKICGQLTTTADPHAGIGESFGAFLDTEVRRQVAAGASEFLETRSPGAAKNTTCNRRSISAETSLVVLATVDIEPAVPDPTEMPEKNHPVN